MTHLYQEEEEFHDAEEEAESGDAEDTFLECSLNVA